MDKTNSGRFENGGNSNYPILFWLRQRFNANGTYVIHPILIGLYPVVSLVAVNISQMPLQGSLRACLILLGITLALLLLLSFVLHGIHRAGVLTSFYLLIYFSYGNILIFLLKKNWLQSTIGRPDILIVIIFVLLVFVSIVIFRARSDFLSFTKILNFASVILILLPIYTIINFLYINRSSGLSWPSPDQIVYAKSPQNELANPDIYYIILDAYARADVLNDLYLYDNSELIDFLKAKGFYVAENSHSNYIQTALSISSSLNMEYLDFIPSTYGSTSQTRYPLIHLIEDNQVHKFLKDNGYQTTAFQTGYDLTNLYNAEHFVKNGEPNNLEEKFLNGSLSFLFFPTMNQDKRRNSIQNIFGYLENVPVSDQPNFVFAHIISPHPPFIFGPNGEPRTSNTWFQDGSYYPEGPDDYIPKYRDQLRYVSKLLEETVNKILSKPGRKPVIIIQSDHGSGAYLDWNSAENSCIRERTSILNAYYFPDQDTSILYDSITPVNSFRVVFNTFFDAQLDLLKDKSYYSGWDTPYQFVDVIDHLEYCPVLGSENW